MAYVTWTPRYSVKVKRFDEDHQTLFQIVNELHDGMKSGRDREFLQSVLARLLRCAEEHFAREEAMMKSRGYVYLWPHAKQHRAFTGKVKQFCGPHKAGAITVEMLDFLTYWLARHIVGTDQQYSDFLNAKGVV